ncbi:uncharacterized protein LOC143862223 [Tasmannia lanceolata]|uniref:uncharacterized protein LOC143862223 n=1 Tax=Tasmannia lanceolata TaxID=3420 RepID=UPI0040631667
MAILSRSIHSAFHSPRILFPPPLRFSSSPLSSFLPLNLLPCSYLGFPILRTRQRSGLYRVMNAGPPSPKSDEPFDKDPLSTIGLEANFYRIRDGAQIFFAVLFWMSLFFWASAWDGRDNGRPNKGSRFRRVRTGTWRSITACWSLAPRWRASRSGWASWKRRIGL